MIENNRAIDLPELTDDELKSVSGGRLISDQMSQKQKVRDAQAKLQEYGPN
jgi:bacteriocin-like protein